MRWLVVLLVLGELLAVVHLHAPAFATFPRCTRGSPTAARPRPRGDRQQLPHGPAAAGLRPAAARLLVPGGRRCACPGCYGPSLLSVLLSRGGDGGPGGEGDPRIEEGPAGEKGEDGGSKGEEKLDGVSAAMISTLQGYKKFISPLLPPSCRFLPTCSAYSMQAIKEYGPTKGVALTAWRLVRCNPFHWGGGGRGYDPPRWPPVDYNYHYP